MIRRTSRLVAGIAALAAGPALFAAPAPPDIVVSDTARIVTFGFNSADYNQTAKVLSDAMLTEKPVAGLTGGKTLVLGPVDQAACLYRFDARKFQEKMQAVLVRSGKVQASFAIDAMQDKGAAATRYKTMRLQWEKESTVDPEELRVLGRLARIDFILFGRVSAQTASKGRNTEVTYTFNWKLGDCETGLIVWTKDEEFTKSGRTSDLPEWITDPPSGSESHMYEIASAAGEKAVDELREDALRAGRIRFAARATALLGNPALFMPLAERDIVADIAPQGTFEAAKGRQTTAYVLTRYSMELFDAERAKRAEPLRFWTNALALLASASQIPSADTRKEIETAAVRDLRALLNRHPVGAPGAIRSGNVALYLADFEKGRNRPCEARILYESVRDRGETAELRDQARKALAGIVCKDEDRERAVWRNVFEGRRVGVVCSLVTDGNEGPWDKLAADVSALVISAGGVASPVAGIGAKAAAALAAGDPAAVAAAGGHDVLVVFAAEVRIEESNDPNPRNLSGKRCLINGDKIRVSIIEGGKTISPADLPFTKTFPMDRRTCLGIAAATTLNLWKQEYLRQQGFTTEETGL